MSEEGYQLPWDVNDPTLEAPSRNTMRYAYLAIIDAIWKPYLGVEASIELVQENVMQAVDNEYNALSRCTMGMAFGSEMLKAIIYPTKGVKGFRTAVKGLWQAKRYGYSEDDLNTAIQKWAKVITEPSSSQYKTCTLIAIKDGARRVSQALAHNIGFEEW